MSAILLRKCEFEPTCANCKFGRPESIFSMYGVDRPFCQSCVICYCNIYDIEYMIDIKRDDLLYCPTQKILRVDRDRCSGSVVCDECGKLYYDHPEDLDFPFLRVVCDGSLVKL